MRQDSAAWERAAEVHEAAQGWLRVGAIDEPTEHAIREAFPDPCITPSAVWRVLTACVVAAVIAFTFEAFSRRRSWELGFSSPASASSSSTP